MAKTPSTKFPSLPRHSRWTILSEALPAPKRQAERSFVVQCSCEAATVKTLLWRYVAGQSLSCGCLRRERAAVVGRENLSALRRIGNAYTAPAKLPSAEELRKLSQTMTGQQIAEKFGVARYSVVRKLAKINP